MAWAAVAGSAVSVVGGLLGKKSSNSAANTQANASNQSAQQYLDYANQAIKNNNDQLDWTKSLYSPYLASGNNALSALNYALGTTYGGPGASASGSQSSITPVSAKKISIDDLIDSSGSTWAPNKELYSSSPEYRDAYDKLYAAQQRIYGGIPFYSSSASDLATAKQLLNNSYGFNVDSYNAKQQADADAQNAKQQADWNAQKTTAQGDPKYGSLLKNFSLEDFQADPSYQFRQSEGEKGINRSLSSRGMYDSGAALKELNRYNSDLASQEYGNAYNRDNQNKSRMFNFLQSVAGMGQNATNSLAGVGAAYANTNSNLLTGAGQYLGNSTQAAGNAKAAGQVGGANALLGGIASGWNNYQMGNALGNFGNSGGNSGGSSGYSGGRSFGNYSSNDWYPSTGDFMNNSNSLNFLGNYG